MDEEVMTMGEEKVVVPPEPTVPVEQPKKAKPLKLLAGIAIILVAVALGLTMLGGNKGASTPTNNSNPTTPTENKYQNKEYFYELTLPPKWQVQPTSAETQSMNFTTSGDAIMTVKAVRQQGDLESYLANLTGVKVNKSSPVRVGGYDGVEQNESWTSQGIQVTSAYVKIQDMIYSLTLLPTGGKNAVTNESLIREYKSVLASFRLTDTTNLGKDWVKYVWNDRVILYPQNWKLSEASDKSGFSIYRDNYEIKFQKTDIQRSTCVFSDSQAISGYAGDLRDKEFVEIEAELAGGYILRRYFKGLMNGKTTMYFCQKSGEDESYFSPLDFGTLVYSVPPQYDKAIVGEMDKIIETLSRVGVGD